MKKRFFFSCFIIFLSLNVAASHNFMDLSMLQVAKRERSGLNVMSLIAYICAGMSETMPYASLTSQIFRCASRPVVNRYLPSGEYLTENTEFVCAWIVFFNLNPSKSKICTLQSLSPVANSLVAILTAMLRTLLSAILICF